jgi:hypothetical protein
MHTLHTPHSTLCWSSTIVLINSVPISTGAKVWHAAAAAAASPPPSSTASSSSCASTRQVNKLQCRGLLKVSMVMIVRVLVAAAAAAAATFFAVCQIEGRASSGQKVRLPHLRCVGKVPVSHPQSCHLDSFRFTSSPHVKGETRVPARWA